VQSVTDVGGVITLGLDDAVPATGPGGASNKFIGLRLLGEAQYRIFQVQAFTGTARSVTLVGAWPAGVPLPGSVGAGGQVHDALWVFDFKATPGLKVVVSKVEPMGGMTGAQVTVVPLPDEFWPFVNSGAYTPPPNRSLLNTLPVITNGRVTDLLIRQGNTFMAELTVAFDVENGASYVDVWGAYGDLPLEKLGTTQSREFTWQTLSVEPTDWDIELRPFSSLGRAGAAYRLSHSYAGLDEPPANVSYFTINGRDVSWTPVADVDVQGYEIRWTPSTTPDWGSAQKIHEGLLTYSPWTLPNIPAEGSLLIKAQDTSGKTSKVAAAIVYPGAESVQSHVISQYSFSGLDFPGNKTGCSLQGGALLADGVDLLMWNPNYTVGMWTTPLAPFYKTEAWSAMTYECSFTPSLPVVASYIDLTVVASGVYAIEYRTSGADPWLPWVGAVPAAAGKTYSFRFSAQYGSDRGILQQMVASVTVDPREETLNDVSIPSAGLRLPISANWNQIVSCLLTVQGSGTGAIAARAIDKNHTSGPLVQCFNEAGTAVAGLVDAQLKGY
jgi:hypothetical protein